MALFLKIIEWKNDDRGEIAHLVKVNGRDVNGGSKIIVRPAQMAIFVHKGQIADIFGEGTHVLDTGILPILSALAGWKYGFRTPTSVDLYFVDLNQFTGMKWGTANPVILRDPEFGMVRVTGYGGYSFRVGDAAVFLRELLGTKASFRTEDIGAYLKKIAVSGLSDCLGESGLSVLDLAGNLDELSKKTADSVRGSFHKLGLVLENFVIENLSVPQEVQKAIDERTKYGIVGGSADIMMKVAAAEAMKAAAENPGGGAGIIGAGMGLGLGSEFGRAMGDAMKQPEKGGVCPHCGARVSPGAKFCGECGSGLSVSRKCAKCGAQVGASDKFCPECGAKL